MSLDKGSNNKLVASFLKGDEKAFDMLYRLYFPRLFSYSTKIVENPNMANDIVQNVFIKVWENPKILKTENPEAFLFKMIKNASLNYIRHQLVVNNHKLKIKEKYLGEELYYIDFVGNEPVELISSELHARVEQVMEMLPPKCRSVFLLSRIEGMKNSEIAEKLNVSIKNIEKHISKALSIYRANFADILPVFVLIISFFLDFFKIEVG